ncbi:hypothetical protein BJ170DRAFT_691992 [Xylariales sp. AK1849]|nr:hypothetical protein BJ170DRAFT_691992 [Xylariales sp. AK1849]
MWLSLAHMSPLRALKAVSNSNTDDTALNACYFACNAAYLKTQISRQWEDYCAAGSAFESYWNNCLCCVQPKLGNGYQGNDLLAKDFQGMLNICDNDPPSDLARLHDSSPCTFSQAAPASPIVTPFPTKTVWEIRANKDSKNVGVSTTYVFSQLRPGHIDQPVTTSPASLVVSSTEALRPEPTVVATTSSMTVTDASGSISISQSTFFITATPMGSPYVSDAASDKSSSPNAWIAGPVIGAAFFVLLSIGGFVLIRNRMRTKQCTQSDHHLQADQDSFREAELHQDTIEPQEKEAIGVYELEGGEIGRVTTHGAEETPDGESYHTKPA